MIKLSFNKYVSLAKEKNYEVFKDGKLNIVGYRNTFGRPNYFDDTIAVYFEAGVSWNEYFYAATTRPGVPYLRKPVNKDGAAILVPGQYVDCYRLGLHRGLYDALVQVGGPVRVYRDNDKDDVFDVVERTIQIGYYGINIHKASLSNRLVGVNSAGCQVIQSSSDYQQFLQLCDEAADNFGNRFTYTLVEL